MVNYTDLNNKHSVIGALRLDMQKSTFSSAEKALKLRLLDQIETSLLLTPGMRSVLLQNFAILQEAELLALQKLFESENANIDNAVSGDTVLAADLPLDSVLHHLTKEVSPINEEAQKSSDQSKAEDSLDNA